MHLIGKIYTQATFIINLGMDPQYTTRSLRILHTM